MTGQKESRDLFLEVLPFLKANFFGVASGSLSVFYDDREGFEENLLKFGAKVIPSFKGGVRLVRLGKPMSPSQILAEKVLQGPFSVDQALAVVRGLVAPAPETVGGFLPTDGCTVLVYAQTDEGLVEVNLAWDFSCGDWDLDVNRMDDDGVFEWDEDDWVLFLA